MSACGMVYFAVNFSSNGTQLEKEMGHHLERRPKVP
jgi:hypothetical protein